MRRLLVVVLLFLPSLLQAALTWDSLSQKVQASSSDVKAETVFSFKNTGKTVVTIDSVRSTCGCTTADLDRRVYKPGESGSIKAVFTFGDRVGDQHKTIGVVYHEDGDPVTVQLELFVNIPDSVVVNPRVQYWKVGDAAAARPVVITLAGKFPGRPTGAAMYSDHSNFIVSKPEKMEDGTYIMSLTPRSTADAQTEAGEIVFEIPGAEPKRVMFYASVRP